MSDVAMREKTHTTAVVVIPPRSAWTPIQEIRRIHDRQFRRWMPHVNLVYPFRPAEAFTRLEPSFIETCVAIEPFDLLLEHVRYFAHGRNHFTVWLEPRPPERLERLREALTSVVPDCDDLARFPSGFTPHLSLGQAGGRRELEAVLGSLRKGWRPLRFAVEAVYFIRRGRPPADVFEVAARIPLGGSPASDEPA